MLHTNPYIKAISYLEEAKVDYVIVGGFAVVMHGCNRFTPDLNVMVSHEPQQLDRLVSLLAENGFAPTTDADSSKLMDSTLREELSQGGKKWFFSFRDMEEPSFSLELFLKFPIPFKEVYEGRQVISFAEGSFNVSSLRELIKMKDEAGRGQDKADIEALEFITQIDAVLKDGGDENAVLALAKDESEKERIEGFYSFMKLNPDEKLAWLGEMLSHLGKFCV